MTPSIEQKSGEVKMRRLPAFNWAEEADSRAGRRIECPTLVVTGAAETQLAEQPTSGATGPPNMRAETVLGGHFIPVEAS